MKLSILNLGTNIKQSQVTTKDRKIVGFSLQITKESSWFNPTNV